MGEVLGEILPIALAVAISPMHLLAVVWILLAPRATPAAMAFWGGRTVGIGLLLTVFSVVVGPVEYATTAPDRAAAALKIAVGAGMIALAVAQWLGRGKRGTSAVPRYLSTIGSAGVGKAFGIGVLLSLASIKNLTLCLAGGLAIGSVELEFWQIVLAITGFTVLAGSVILAVIIVAVIAGTRTGEPLEKLQVWLIANRSQMLSLVPLLIGIAIAGKGIAELIIR